LSLKDDVLGKPINSPYWNFCFCKPRGFWDITVLPLTHTKRHILSLQAPCAPCPLIQVPLFLTLNSRLLLTVI